MITTLELIYERDGVRELRIHSKEFKTYRKINYNPNSVNLVDFPFTVQEQSKSQKSSKAHPRESKE